jgi:hypothetical protein
MDEKKNTPYDVKMDDDTLWMAVITKKPEKKPEPEKPTSWERPLDT